MERLVIEHFEDRINRNEYIKERKRRELPKNAKGRMLEIGCGTRLTYAPKTDEVCGIDISIKMARHFAKNNPNAQTILADARSLPFQKKSFHVIVMNSVIHHLIGRTPQESEYFASLCLREIKHVLAKSGIVLILELLARNYFFTLLMYYVTLILAKLDINIDFLDIHSKVVTYFHTDRILRRIASGFGFAINHFETSSWKLLNLELGQDSTYILTQNSL